MHLGILSGLIVALAGSFSGGGSAHTTGATYQTNLHNTAALYSILAQTATTPTVAAGITPTALATGSVQAATTITATGTTTGTTASTSPTSPPYTPAPIATTVPQANLQINPFDWNFLTGYPTEPKLGPFAIAYLVLILAVIGVSIYFLRFRGPGWKTTNPVLFRAVNRFAVPALWIAGLGILFLIFRIIPLDLFNLRFWLYLDFLALLGLGGWIFYWWRTSYPKEMAKYLKTQKARQYMPGGSGKLASRSTPVAAPAKGGQQARTSGPAKPASPSSKPPQQSNKNRKPK